MTLYQSKKEAVRLLKQEYPEGGQPQEMMFAVDYLTFFGYLGMYLLKNLTAEDLKSAVKLFQKTFGIKADGLAGPKTLTAMRYPRCGCPDFIDKERPDHVQYLEMREEVKNKQNKWMKQELKYVVDSYVTGIPQKVQDKIIAQSFKAWTDVAGIDICQCPKRDKKNADILVGTGIGKQYNFDGQGGTLAWAYMPEGADRQLRMRFDLEEIWVQHQYERGVWMLPVATHEIGHLLGLDHSKVKEALMAPYYNPFVSSPQLKDDITRIQKLYGKPKNAAAIEKNTGRTVMLRSGEELLVICE